MASPLTKSTDHRVHQHPSGPARPRAVVVHDVLPGRLRINLSGWRPADRVTLERRLQLVPGVRSARATPETGNVLFLFDPGVTSVERLLSAAESALEHGAPRAVTPRASKPHDTSAAPPALRLVATPINPARRSAGPLARKLLAHLPALLSLVLSLLACSTPLGYARFGLEAIQLAVQFGGAGA